MATWSAPPGPELQQNLLEAEDEPEDWDMSLHGAPGLVTCYPMHGTSPWGATQVALAASRRAENS